MQRKRRWTREEQEDMIKRSLNQEEKEKEQEEEEDVHEDAHEDDEANKKLHSSSEKTHF